MGKFGRDERRGGSGERPLVREDPEPSRLGALRGDLGRRESGPEGAQRDDTTGDGEGEQAGDEEEPTTPPARHDGSVAVPTPLGR